MKTYQLLIAASSLFAAPYATHAQNVPPSSQSPLDSSAADTSNHTVTPSIGDNVYDKIGEQVGTISEETDKNVVVTTTQGKVTIPITSLAPGAKGLTINMTKDEFHAAIQAARNGQSAR